MQCPPPTTVDTIYDITLARGGRFELFYSLKGIPLYTPFHGLTLGRTRFFKQTYSVLKQSMVYFSSQGHIQNVHMQLYTKTSAKYCNYRLNLLRTFGLKTSNEHFAYEPFPQSNNVT